MFVLFKEVEFSAAHKIPNHPGPCKDIHGHNYKVRVFVESKELNSLQMVIDFSDLNKIIKEAIKGFDHSFLNDLKEFKDIAPTAEKIAYVIYNKINKMLPESLKLQKIEVYENETSCAIYYP
jgi:6-pyruvoyltetrahydropterin/6-carboxytetrahydropterin synthase